MTTITLQVTRDTWGCFNCGVDRPRDGSVCCDSPHPEDPSRIGAGDTEIEVEVSASITYTRGSRDEPGGFEVDDVEAEVDGKPFALSKSEMADAEEKLIAAAEGEDEGRREDYWEAKAESRREREVE